MSNTKEQILITALHLFAETGYEAVSVSDIAGKLGMTKGALYRHFKNKRDIFESLLACMEENDAKNASEHDVPEDSLSEMEEEYQNTSVESLVEFSKAMFRYWTEDDFASSFRKMLTLEQFRSKEMADLYQQYLASGPLNYVKDLFSSKGIKNAEQRAVEFYSPMFFLYSVYDGSPKKEKVLQMADKAIEESVKDLLTEEKNNEQRLYNQT